MKVRNINTIRLRGIMSNFKSYKEQSKANWGIFQDEGLNINQIQLGAILRIADASEKMASNYVKLENDLKFYKDRYESGQKDIEKLRRSNAALRGVIKRMKGK